MRFVATRDSPDLIGSNALLHAMSMASGWDVMGHKLC